MNDAGFLDAEFDLAALGRLHRFSDVWSHGAKLRVRHQALWTKHLAETANQTHHVRRRDDAIEIDGAALDGFQKIFRTHDVSASGSCLGRLFVARKNSDANGLARSGRQRHDATEHLVSMARIHAQRPEERRGGKGWGRTCGI